MEGRYALLHGLLDGQPVVLGSIYAPNTDQGKFWGTLSRPLSAYTQAPWILGGDFNCVQDITLDRSYPPHPASPIIAQGARFASWMAHWALTDAWRSKHPSLRL